MVSNPVVSKQWAQASRWFFLMFLLSSATALGARPVFADCASDRAVLRENATSISRLKVEKKVCESQNGSTQLMIRSFVKRGVQGVVLVNPETLKTEIEAGSCTVCQPANETDWAGTPYAKLLSQSTSAPFPADNDGIQRGKGDGFFLTIDLCPSHKSFEKRLFEGLYQTPVAHRGSLPVAFAISGLWIRRHGDELQWILDQEAAGKLSVTWVNHTATHPYNPRIPDTRNFLLMPGTDVRSEIEGVEKELLARGIAPSVFFRFPGLISSESLIGKVHSYGLIPLGAEAWLAKGQKIHKGSIVLVHGNGNEPDGINKMLHYIHQYPSLIHLEDLSELAHR